MSEEAWLARFKKSIQDFLDRVHASHICDNYRDKRSGMCRFCVAVAMSLKGGGKS